MCVGVDAVEDVPAAAAKALSSRAIDGVLLAAGSICCRNLIISSGLEVKPSSKPVPAAATMSGPVTRSSSSSVLSRMAPGPWACACKSPLSDARDDVCMREDDMM